METPVILVDAGPLVVLVDADDQYHKKCVAALKALREPLVTVWLPVTEAMYLLGELPQAQKAVWEMLTRGVMQLLSLLLTDVPSNTRVDEQVLRPSDGLC